MLTPENPSENYQQRKLLDIKANLFDLAITSCITTELRLIEDTTELLKDIGIAVERHSPKTVELT